MVRVTRCANGLTVVSESVPDARSATVGFYFEVGSRDEPAGQAGIAHFLEHLVFKGTYKRSAREIVEAFESRGGDVNGETDRELTAYFGRVLADDLPLAVEVLGDMLCHPRLDPRDISLELGVVAEEIKRYEDSPHEQVHDYIARALWPSSALGRPVLGELDALRALSRDDLLEFVNSRYIPQRLIVSAAGRISHDELVRLAEEHFTREPPDSPASPERRAELAPGNVLCCEKDLEQVHLCLGCPGYPMGDERRFALALVNSALGGTASSRLFQEVREKRGLVYSIWSYIVRLTDTGALIIAMGTSAENVPRVLEVVRREAADIAQRGLKPEELERARRHAQGSLVLAHENIAARPGWNVQSLRATGRVMSIDEIVARIGAVTREDTARVAAETLGAGPLCAAAVGPVTEEELKPLVAPVC